MSKKTGDIITKMGDVTHFMEGYFYVGCMFISTSYFLTKFGEWQDMTFTEGDRQWGSSSIFSYLICILNEGDRLIWLPELSNRYHIENLAMGKRGVSSCNWTKLRMGKIKLETLDGNMRVWKLFKGEEDFLPLTFIYPFTFFTTIHLT